MSDARHSWVGSVTPVRAVLAAKGLLALPAQPDCCRGGCVQPPCRTDSVGRLCQAPRRSKRMPRFIPVLWRYAIGERVSVKIGVVTQTRPWAVFLCCVPGAGFLTFGIIVPRIVPSDGEEGPIGAFQVLH